VAETAYEALLDDGILLRIRFIREQDHILSFVVQLERLIGEKWYPVIRYDTAHGYAHCDILWPDGTQEKRPMPVNDFNEALTLCSRGHPG
jgi:hypothetical protein